jgi:hypothetical protein
MSSVSTEPVRTRVANVDPGAYARHSIHGAERTWLETNCYTDLVIEMVHGLGHDPAAMLAFTLGIDFEGDQWTFFKPPASDVQDLYGLDIQELAIWRTVLDHVVEQVNAGRIVMVELDAFWLPDTAGTAYQLTHQKTTVGVNEIDVDAARMAYFHNQGYYALDGDDFRRIFDIRTLPPYAEIAKPLPGFVAPRGPALLEASLATLARQLARAPRDNPFPRFKARLARDVERLKSASLEHFHKYSFATLRQYGACFELAQTYLQWLMAQGVEGLEVPAHAFGEISQGAKALQFQLARTVARGKPLDAAPLDAMGTHWEVAMTLLRSRYG